MFGRGCGANQNEENTDCVVCIAMWILLIINLGSQQLGSVLILEDDQNFFQKQMRGLAKNEIQSIFCSSVKT